jgi:polysaccharide deacetylase family protein (PEP-CTERM system associated)
LATAMTPTDNRVRHVFSVDVEEYFHVNAFERIVARESWHTYPSRVAASTEQLLELLDRHGARGTFFVLGWLAERQPALIRRIAAAGHEIASHGWWHRRIVTIGPGEFREEVRTSKSVLESITGEAVLGYRAPSFSILPGMEWAFDVLLEEGYRYDSSLFPIQRAGYGSPDAPTYPHFVTRPAGKLLELPMTVTSIAGRRVAASGGGWLRHLPYGVTQRAFRQHDERRVPAMLYLHPWEIDGEQPRLSVPVVTRLRHYGGISRMRPRLERMLREFRFTTAREAHATLLGHARATAPVLVEAR